jgi:rare lipoprotein A
MIRSIISGLLAAVLILGAAFFMGSATIAGECALASWYGQESGNRTANGEPFDGSGLTAAHRSLPFGTRLRVTYQGRSVIVRINDRGPYIKGRALDLSRAAAARIGLVRAGVARVCWERL